MSYLVSINKSHITNTLNNQFSYSLPISASSLKDMELCVKKISMYNSVFNIDAERYSNNSFKILVPTGTTETPIQISLPNGTYEYKDINRMIQRALVEAGAYLINSSGDNVFHIELSSNAVYYSSQFDMSLVPTTITGYTRPATGIYSASGSGLPSTSRTMRVIIDNADFGLILGLLPNTYPSTVSTAATSILSNIPPQVSPISSFSVRCSLVDNMFAIPSDMIASFDTQGTQAGQLISYEPNEFSWLSVSDTNQPSIQLTITDQLGRFPKINDPNILIELLFRQKKNI